MNIAADDEVGGNHTDGGEDEVRGSVPQNKQNIGMGLTEQEIKKQTLDKNDMGVASSNIKFNSKFNGSSNFDFTDLESRNHNFRESIIQKEDSNERDIESNAQEDAETQKQSLEYSQNVEVYSDGSSEIKYLLGDEIDVKQVEKRKNNSKGMTVSQKKEEIEVKFIKLYNKQGHYSAQQSILNVYGHVMWIVAKFMQMIFCC